MRHSAEATYIFGMSTPETRRALALYNEANWYINEGLIRRDADSLQAPSTTSPSARPLRGRGAATPSDRTRREWMEWFLPRLGNPQLAYDAIHVAGTSGKGSICAMVAEILRAAGIRTGLHISPYLQVATEKLWIDGVLASAAEYHELIEWLRPHAEAIRGPEVPLHGMGSVAIFLEYFRRQAVELGVVEVGVGGRSDLTNVLKTRVAAVSNVGPDHLKTLGPTLADVAEHKAGIIKAGCRAVVHAVGSAGDDQEAHPEDAADLALIAARRRARAVGAPLRVVRPERDYTLLGPTTDGRTRLSYHSGRLHLDELTLACSGAFQAQNAALAIAICEEADARVDADAVRLGLGRARLAARLERFLPGPRNRCTVVLDGAHNPDKLDALLRSLDIPETARLHLVFGGLAAKTPGPAVRELVRRATTVTFTQPEVYAKAPRPAAELAAELASDHPQVDVEPSCERALELALSRAHPDDLILVTGSIYLVGQARRRFHSDEDVLLRRSSF